jgi:monofunctional biosynthetic peptidoglycan transglycosylase
LKAYLLKLMIELRDNRRTRRYVALFVLFAMLIWFVPPVWRLRGDSIEVTQWVKSKGKITARIGPKERGWTKYSRISRHTINAVISAEDGKFYQHNGLDLESIADSFEENFRKGRYVRGGSTITQQLVKMAFLSRNKNILRKAREAVGTLLVEQLLEKRQIIEWYLNMAEFGDGIYGIEAAARHYFGTKPEMMTSAQSIHLALVLPSPNSWSSGLRKRNLTPFGHRRFGAIVSNMYRGGYITKEQWISSLATGNFGAPINGYQNLIAQYESENQPQISDPRFVAPGSGDPEDVIDQQDDAESVASTENSSPSPTPESSETPSSQASAAPSEASQQDSVSESGETPLPETEPMPSEIETEPSIPPETSSPSTESIE